MNGNNTRYSSSSLLKNAQTWRGSPSCDPAKEMGAETFLIVVPPRLGSSSPRHLPEEDEPPRRCVSIVLWYRFCRSDRQQHTKHQRGQSLKRKDGKSTDGIRDEGMVDTIV